jgi:predicted MFS family arabinose efflux permease
MMILFFSLQTSLVVAIVLSILAPCLFACLPPLRHWQRSLKAPTEGSFKLFFSPYLRHAFILQGVAFGVGTGLQPVITELAIQSNHLAFAGVAFSAGCGGLLTGAIIYSSYAFRFAFEKLLVVSTASISVVFLFASLVPSLTVLTGLFFLYGCVRAAIAPSVFYLVNTHVEEARLSEANGAITAVIFLGNSLGPAFGGVMVAAFDPSYALLGLALISGAAVCNAMLLYRTTRQKSYGA